MAWRFIGCSVVCFNMNTENKYAETSYIYINMVLSSEYLPIDLDHVLFTLVHVRIEIPLNYVHRHKFYIIFCPFLPLSSSIFAVVFVI